jgi:hypothetical protein
MSLFTFGHDVQVSGKWCRRVGGRHGRPFCARNESQGGAVGRRNRGQGKLGISDRGTGLVPQQGGEPGTERRGQPTPGPAKRVPKSKKDPGKALCGRCGHRRRDHGQRNCLVCFACTSFTADASAQANRASRARCACTHRRDRHLGNEGPCGTEACRCRHYRPQIPDGVLEEQTSVRAIPSAFESNRRRH